jgi:hypothetical protein
MMGIRASELRGRLGEESGMTLVEAAMASSMLLVVMGILFSILTSVHGGLDKQTDRTNDNAQARLAMQQLDREIRSGNVLYDPASEGSPFIPYYSLRVYTQSNANIRNPGNRCVQWRIVDQQLQRRDWATGDPAGSVSGWRIVAENIVNRDLDTPVPAFVLDADPNKGGRIVDITIVVQTDADSGSPIQIQASISGRNTTYGYPLNVCATIPPA